MDSLLTKMPLKYEPFRNRVRTEELTNEKIQEIEDNIKSWDNEILEQPIKPRGWLKNMIESARCGNGEDAVCYLNDGTLHVNDCYSLAGLEIEISPDGNVKVLAIS